MASVGETAIPVPAARSFLRLNLLNDVRGRVRLGTLNNLRWLAVVGQAVALLVVRLALNFDFPVLLAASPIAASAVMNREVVPASRVGSSSGPARSSPLCPTTVVGRPATMSMSMSIPSSPRHVSIASVSSPSGRL